LTGRRKTKVLRASEIGSYVYCARGWWLNRVLGYPSAHKEQMALGEEKHRGHGREVVAYHRLRRLAYLMLALALLLTLFVLCWWFATGLLT
jgi:CRISPR/Cas system-associated exonuclease Cas4 (RecB family)